MPPLLPPYTPKRHGDRVRLPKHPASWPNTTYWYGTVVGDRVEWDNPNDVPDHYDLRNSTNEAYYGILQDA